MTYKGTIPATVREPRSGCPDQLTVGTDAANQPLGLALTGDEDDCSWVTGEGWLSDFLAGHAP